MPRVVVFPRSGHRVLAPHHAPPPRTNLDVAPARATLLHLIDGLQVLALLSPSHVLAIAELVDDLVANQPMPRGQHVTPFH